VDVFALQTVTFSGTEALNMPAKTAMGQTTITGKNQISIPAKSLRRLGWERGDRLLVQVLDDQALVIIRRPKIWTEEFAGRLGHVFGTHDENLRWLNDERRSWDEEPAGDG